MPVKVEAALIGLDLGHTVVSTEDPFTHMYGIGDAT